MQLGHRSLLLSILGLFILSGCDLSSPWGSSSSGSEYGAASVIGNSGDGGTGTGTTGGGGSGKTGGIGGESGTNGSDDTAVATPSSSSLMVAIGATQTLSITFTSSDGLAITGFGVYGSLGTLPVGWSGPSTFSCALVATGSGCVLNLTYAPTAADSGTLVIDYLYVDNAGLSKAPGGSLSIPYQAIAANNVVASVAPSGQINASVGGGSQSVGITFTTDDGDAATGLSIASLGALPAGWSSASPSFSCAIVSSGSGCQLMLTYAPTAAARGTLALSYSYTDDSGAARTGTVNIPYSTTFANNVVATAAPTGQITAIEKGAGRAVAITFTTDDGASATNFMITSDLTALPAGWRSSSSALECANVSTGNGCALHLTYAPTALASGTLTLTYAYTDNVGTAQTGTLNLAYTATTNDDVVGTASPSGQINAVVGAGSQPVSVTFTTNDARPATALVLTTSLATLPSGWSSTDSSFACSGVAGGNACQLPLTYTPSAAGSGTLSLNYTYMNDAGEAKTGTVNIPYRATTNDTVVGTPSQNPLAVLVGSNTAVTVTFATDDGNPASGLSVTSGLTSLPAGWSSGSSTFSCATVSAGTICQLSLAYAPTTAGNGNLILMFSYTNNAGIAKTASVTIAYSAT